MECVSWGGDGEGRVGREMDVPVKTPTVMAIKGGSFPLILFFFLIFLWGRELERERWGGAWVGKWVQRTDSTWTTSRDVKFSHVPFDSITSSRSFMLKSKHDKPSKKQKINHESRRHRLIR